MADLNITNNFWMTPLHSAVKNGHLAVAKFLLNAGANAKMYDREWYTPLHTAVKNRDMNMIRELLKASVDVNFANRQWNTPLHTAVQNRDLDVMRELINAGAKINLCNRERNTPLHAAVKNPDLNVIMELLKSGVLVNLKNSASYTALHFAVQSRLNSIDEGTDYPLDILKELVKYGADIQIRGNIPSPLNIAIEKYDMDPECTKTLIKISMLKKGGESALCVETFKNRPFYNSVVSYINKCASEIRQMKNVRIKDYTLYDMVSKQFRKKSDGG